MTLPAVACVFAAPNSYTSEDIIEFHIPGNPLLARMLVDAIVQAGARHAEPGEFTARAYFSGRMDLAEAEGVAATISAQNAAELRGARQLLAGELSRRLRPLMDRLAATLALVEVGIDFSDEDVTFLPSDEVQNRAMAIDESLEDLVNSSARFERLSHEPTFILVGRPNAGKSTLLNALAGHDRAVVSPEAGTTRDAISADIHLLRGIIRIFDVAGIDECGNSAGDIERQMNAQAQRTLESADRVIQVRDVTDPRPPTGLRREADLIVFTKCDLIDANISGDGLRISANTGDGMPRLLSALDQLAFGQAEGSPTLALNARHLTCIADARAALSRISESDGPELIAADLRDALDALGRIVGEVSPDDVLGRIFGQFCIGK